MTTPPRGFPHGLPVVSVTAEERAASRLLEEHADLATRLSWVAAQVARLPKTRQAPTGSGGSYAYTPVEDMAAAITRLCALVRVAMLPEVVDPLSEGADWRSPEPGNTRTRWRYLYRVTWVVSAGREERRVQTMGEAMDWGDKGSNKAMTAARKYLYMMLFHLQTGDDTDASRPEVPPAESGERPAQQQRRQQARQRAQERPQAAPAATGSSSTPAPSSAPQAPALSPDDARKARRRHAAVALKAGNRAAANAWLATLEPPVTSLAQLLEVQTWLRVCERAEISPSDPLPPDPIGDEAVAAQAARGSS